MNAIIYTTINTKRLLVMNKQEIETEKRALLVLDIVNLAAKKDKARQREIINELDAAKTIRDLVEIKYKLMFVS